MDKKSAFNIHLTLNYVESNDGFVYFSTLCGALKDARNMTGRNIETGVKDNSNKFGYLGSWLGAMGYITILDQIGKCYRPSTTSPIEKTKSPIIRALKYFTKLSDDQIDALYSLRNAFFHDYSLINKDNPKRMHQFIVDNHPTNPVVVLPKISWDGELNNRNDKNATYVNLQALGDLVESLYNNLLTMAKENNLEIQLDGKEDELVSRYLVATPKSNK